MINLARNDIRSAVINDIQQIDNIPMGTPINRVIIVNNVKLQYTVYQLPDGTFNIGRIHGVN